MSDLSHPEYGLNVPPDGDILEPILCAISAALPNYEEGEGGIQNHQEISRLIDTLFKLNYLHSEMTGEILEPALVSQMITDAQQNPDIVPALQQILQEQMITTQAVVYSALVEEAKQQIDSIIDGTNHNPTY